MNKILLATLGFAIFLAMTYSTTRGTTMQEVKIDIGKNIVDTAKRSGAPRFERENHRGFEIFELVNLKPDVTVRYIRPGYEINVAPVFSLTMYADSDNRNDMAVERIELQYAFNAKSHDEAKNFVETLIKQFHQGHWKRYIDETWPAVSGRSAYLDVSGKIDARFPLDPTYKTSSEDWIQLSKSGSRFEWIGDGVRARLEIRYYNEPEGPKYSFDLEFQDFAIHRRKMATLEARQMADGDLKGWQSTLKHKNATEENQKEIRILEANAVRRGDLLVSRD